MSSAEYRPDIDGLRALAVTIVILSHLHAPWFGGGFVGVDVFFVISGYLIASVIQRDVELHRFSLIHFYERRIRRIFPALFAMMAIVSLVAYVLLLPSELVNFAKSLVATTLFASNIYFWWDTGYFAAQALTKPLLHTWSLGVEEQFYLLFPLLVLGLSRFRRSGAITVMTILAALSFAACVWATADRPDNAYFLPHYRAWELLVGALYALSGRRALPTVAPDLVAGLGFAMIMFAAFWLDGGTHFPGPAALLPVMGALLVIHAGDRSQTVVGPLLRAPPVVFAGKISYSAYLVHWPVIAFCNYYLFRPLNPVEELAAFVFTFAAAAISWRWIEQPVRSKAIPRSYLFAASGLLVVIFAGIGGATFYAKGFQSGDGGETRRITTLYRVGTCQLAGQPFSFWNEKACTAGADGKPRIFVWGDSYATQYVPGLVALDRFKVTQLTLSACPPVLDETFYCAGFSRQVVAHIIKTKPDMVVISAVWRGLQPLANLDRTMREVITPIRKAGVRVLLLGDAPMYFGDMAQVEHVMRLRGIQTQWYTPVRNEWADPTLRNLARDTGSSFYSPRNFWCRGDKCRFTDGQLFTFDTGHLTAHGSDLIAAELKPVIENALKQ